MNVPHDSYTSPALTSLAGEAAQPVADAGVAPNFLERRIAGLGASLAAGTAFEFQMPGRRAVRVGTGDIKFRVVARNELAVSALRSMDELKIGEAYVAGDLDIDGDLVAALDLRNGFLDRHVLVYLWSTYGQKYIFGQANRDKKWIHEHYDAPPEFYLAFLDRQARCYSHGYFESDDETLESAIQRKLATAMAQARIEPGMRVLDIGGGWGAFTEYAGNRGVQVTSLTISSESEAFIQDLIQRQGLPCRVLKEHFLEYTSEPFDAIVNLGVTEHLPDYSASVAQYERLVRPGGRIYLDACSSRTKYPFSSFTLKYVWPGNATPVHLPSYMEALAETPLELMLVSNDRHSYELTTRHWANRLDAHHEMLASRWGESTYRRFRLYLWGCVHCFATDTVGACRWMLERPVGRGSRTLATRRGPDAVFRRARRLLGG